MISYSKSKSITEVRTKGPVPRVEVSTPGLQIHGAVGATAADTLEHLTSLLRGL